MPALESVTEGIAVVGVAGRFPGANDVSQFWRNLVAGRDGITRFTDEQLAAAGYDPAALRRDPGFVAARGIIDRPEWFDAAFFDIQPKEAEVIDPQQRVFLETAWHALEDAGCDPTRYPGLIGVYAGMTNNSYGRFVRARTDLVDAVGELAVMMGNEKDYLTTRLAYKLNLRGPALSINTACSTSLVAIATACQSLAGYQCDAALAGGVSITFPQTRGYFCREGGMASADGLCRPFDAKAAGAVFSHGCGVVVLKRLSDALAEGDQIYAVVRGWALNNDGAGKVSITAPSVDGQAEVVALAQALAGIPAETIGYLEAHGTGTPMGDPIEVAALTQAFSAETTRRQFCALGSLKSNIGHLDAASGVAGFIKTALVLRHACIPATLHFGNPNPELQLEGSPFHIPTQTLDWPRGAEPRRAGVSSFGVGGTNAHAVLEEAPEVPKSLDSPSTTALRAAQVLTLSAKNVAALAQSAQDLAAHLEAHPGLSLANAAFTLQTGRRQFPHRRAIVAETTAAAVLALRAEAKITRHDHRLDTPVAFLFPGQGCQYTRMGAELYESEPVFRATLDAVADLLQPELGLDLRTAIFSGDAERLRQTRITQPAIFAVEYALARMWMSFGLRPAALLGHSVGEYVAATIAGVFAWEDAARLVAARARLVQELPGGAMLAVRLGEGECQEFVSDEISLAAINSPRLCVLSGPVEAIALVEALLATRNIAARRLPTSHAFHSAMLNPVITPFAELVRKVPLAPPEIPFLSNLTGNWITPSQATDPDYWASHVRAAVRFSDGLGHLLASSDTALLEVGPGNGLTQLARQHPHKKPAHEFAHTLAESAPESTSLATAQARLWLAGVNLDWQAVHAGEVRRRVTLPGYPFQRQRYFADLPAGVPLPLTATAPDGEPLITPAASASAVASIVSIAPEVTAPRDANIPSSIFHFPSSHGRLIALIKEQSGTDLSDTDPETTLLDLGFDSLFLAQLVLVIQKRFAIRITLLDLFDDLATLRALSAHLETHLAPTAPIPPATPAATPSSDPTIPEPNPVAPANSLPPAPLPFSIFHLPVTGAAVLPANTSANGPSTFAICHLPSLPAQREVWLACQRTPLASAAFNETCTIHFQGALDAAALHRALQAVVARHDMLRTTFSADGDHQIIHPQLTLDLPFEDLSPLPAPERDQRFQTLREFEGPRRFDLTHGPLLAARLVKLTADHHALIFTGHHLACDGWSVDVIMRELGAIYSANRENRPHALPAPMQMSDYQRWEQAEQGSAAFAAARSYWLNRFRTLPPPFDLPGDRPRPAQRSDAGARESIFLPADLHRQVIRTGAKHGATPFVTLLSAFQTLLFRLSGEHDFVVGVPAAGQNLAGGQDLIGHCVNLLAVRASLTAALPFSDLLHSTRTDLFAAFEHQRFNFGQLVRELPLPRDRSRVPLIGCVFNLDPRLSDLRFASLRHRIELNPRVAYQFDFGFNCVEEDGSLRVNCDFNTDLFDAATIRRWLHHYRTLLTEIVAAPATPLSRLRLLDATERARLLSLSRGPQNGYPADTPLDVLFRERAAQHPDAVAVIDNNASFTYAEIESRANQVARHLLALDLQPGQFVALCGQRSARFVWETIGVLRAGGAYLPLHPDDPAERVRLVETTCALMLLDGTAYSAASTNPVRSAAHASGAAYLLYTSGSTGLPKGVVVPHRAVTRLVWNTNYVSFQADDVVAFASNLSFDAATFELWGALLHGARLVVTQSEHLLTHDGPAAHYTRHGVTVTFVTTALFNRFARQFPSLFAKMRCVVFGGEMGDATAVRAVLTHGKPAHLMNGYGPTETTTFAAALELTDLPEDRVPVGTPIANTDVYILDEALEPVPIGVAGEIYIGGPGLAIGYHGDADLTAQRFFSTPLGRLYKSGDRARWTASGVIEVLGRADRQIKLRGIRIEPGDIETHLQQFPHIRQAAVVPYRDRQGELALAGYLVPKNGNEPSVTEVRHFLRDRVAPALIPSSLIWLPHLPLTANGKLDIPALPAPAEQVVETARVSIAPRTPIERQLAEIWEEVLDRRPIGIHDDFFALGGHSLLAARAIALIAERLRARLDFGEFFDHPTIEKHALLLAPAAVTVTVPTSAAAPAPAPYTVLHPEAPGTPVFFFHGDVLGGGMYCQTLASEIGADRPFYVLHPHGLHGEEIPFTLGAMAVERLKWIRQIQPHGPYILGGYCNGALLAHETARLLRAAGGPVSVVLMLFADGSNIRYRTLRRWSAVISAWQDEDQAGQRRRFLRLRDAVRHYEMLGGYYASAASDLLKQPPGTQIRRLWRKSRRILSRFVPQSLRSSVAGVDLPAKVPCDPASRHKEAIMNVYDDICRAYLPGPCDAPTVLLWPQEEPPPSSRGPAHGWKQICARFEVVPVPGNHASSVAKNTNIIAIAAAMKAAILQALRVFITFLTELSEVSAACLG